MGSSPGRVKPDYEIHRTNSPGGSQDPELLIRFKFMRNYQKFQLVNAFVAISVHMFVSKLHPAFVHDLTGNISAKFN